MSWALGGESGESFLPLDTRDCRASAALGRLGGAICCILECWKQRYDLFMSWFIGGNQGAFIYFGSDMGQ